jgi:phage shock protein E
MINLKKLLPFTSLFLATFAQAEPVYIDVRTQEEYNAEHIEGDTLMPLAELNTDTLAERFGKDAELILYCRTGNRSGMAIDILKEAGFTNLTNGGSIVDVRTTREHDGYIKH